MNYTIEGEPLPVLICNMEAGETMLTEKGAMSWMSPNMKMETTTNGGIGKMFGRAFSGESMFVNRYTAQGGPGLIAFASSFPVLSVLSKSHRDRISLRRKVHSWPLHQGLICPFSSRNAYPAVSSEVRALSCRNFPETEWLFWNSMAASRSMT